MTQQEPRLRFGILGPLAVWDETGAPVTVPEAKVRALLATLLAHDGGPVTADRLIQDLWGDHPPGKPAGALQAKVSQLRRIVGRDGVERQPAGYRLRIEHSDAAQFRDLVIQARATADPRARATRFAEALHLWRGEAFADFADEEFARSAAHRLSELRLAAVEEQAKAQVEAGDYSAADDLADVIARHPLREGLRAAQMRALYSRGRQSEAVASYTDLRTRLAEELGVDPSPDLRALYESLLRQDSGLAAEPRGNFPRPLTPLIGREEALAQLAGLSSRLVTLTGPGGVGKSRLAVELVSAYPGSNRDKHSRDEFRDGCWLVELAGVRGTAADLAETVAAVLGIRDSIDTASPAQRLATALRDRRMLLVLDNCEHVVEAVAELVESLLRNTRDLRILTTSQEPLGLPGETVFAVEPLPPADAVRLFTERAIASAPDFAGDLDTITEICRRLDGLPLALELAATRVRGLGVRELAARLNDRFAVLTRGSRGAPARQQTLRAVLDWSWELLSEPERTVLSRLAVHRDSFDLAAAEAVCAGDGDVLDLVLRLVDRSLVAVTNGPAGIRYRLLESVAAYAVERLADPAATRARHLRHYLEIAESAQLHGTEQRAWLTRLDVEAGNLRAALDEAICRAPSEAVRLATALSWWWLLRGRLTEGRRMLSAVLLVAAPDPDLTVLNGSFALLTGEQAPPDSPDSARALWLRAYSLFSVGDLAASHEVNARALATAGDDEWGVAAALGLRAMLSLVRGDLAGLGRDGLRSAELFRRLGDRWGEMQTIPPLAALAEIKGDYAEAARRQHEGLAIARELDLQAEVSARLSGLGRLALLERDWPRARDLHEQALRIAADHGYTYGRIHAEMGLALGARRSGDLDAAEHHLTHIRDEYRGLSSTAGDHLLYAELGFVAELRGDAVQAKTYHLQGLEYARMLDEPRAFALSLEGLAGAAAPQSAALLLGAADAARRSVNAPLPAAERGDVDRITEAAQGVLGSGFARVFEQGARLSVEDAVRVACGDSHHRRPDHRPAPRHHGAAAPPG
ncbi:BTAD domain-containing putative transcriptional regulator [Amycolatopsis circi]|uniref:BTAD domain-containing putative transcriptional regulator n=1 Tax=Amycolatopsis circi TaxID=871959 RepID=UPI001FCA34A6|nr:BTAD domain-containing putative transcriptional regulator [Amycolatopsis circi]